MWLAIAGATFVLGLFVGAAFAASAPATTSSATAPTIVSNSTVTVTAPPATVTAPPVTVTVAAAQSPTQVTAPTTQTVAAPVKVPSGVGMNYQAAQDLWRTAGLVVMPATDALGANRLAVIDSSWVVVAQDVPAGTTVAHGSPISATIKKYADK